MSTARVIKELNPTHQVEKRPFPAILKPLADNLYKSNRMEAVWRGHFTEILYLPNSSNHQRESSLPRRGQAQIGEKSSLAGLDRCVRPLLEKLLNNNLLGSDYAARYPVQDSSAIHPEVSG